MNIIKSARLAANQYDSLTEFQEKDGINASILALHGITPEFLMCKTGSWYDSNGELHRDNDLPAIEHINGGKEWWRNGKLHRRGDQPAIEHISGYKAWYVNGELHRNGDDPSVICLNGTELWYQYGKLHRTCGPAIITKTGAEFWYLNNIELTQTEWLKSL